MGPASSSFGSATRLVLSQRSAFFATAAFSGAINVLGLTSPLFMLQVYDRVLMSGSLSTLAALLMLVTVLYAAQTELERLRARIFVRLGQVVGRPLGRLAFDAALSGSGKSAPLRDVEQIRAFLAGGGPAALFDLPWTPLYLGLLFLLHPVLGLVGLTGALVLAFLTWFTDRATGTLQTQYSTMARQAHSSVENASAARDTIRAMGMGDALRQRWEAIAAGANAAQVQNADTISTYSNISKFVRLLLQSVVLAAGAVLIIRGDATGGVMIASSILLGKTLAPVDQAIAHWRGWVGARHALSRLDDGLAGDAASTSLLSLPAPSRSLRTEGLSVSIDGSDVAVLEGVSFTLGAGDVLGVIGPSGAGKSTLLKALAGLVPLQSGAVRLDGSTLDQWTDAGRGGFVGYMAQSIDLVSGSIAENIARFDPAAPSELVLKAAQAAGMDDLIRGLSDGFATQVGDHGQRLSVGQRQRVALARALYGDPFLLILDEPNSALDRDGEDALVEAVTVARARGAIVVVACHRSGVLSQATRLLALEAGRQRAFGPPGPVLSTTSSASRAFRLPPTS